MVQESPFLTAADGDVSSESIGEDYSQKFRETSADNTMTIPDACTLDSTAFTSSKEHRDSFIDNSYITSTSGVDLTFDGDLMRVNATSGNGWFSGLFTGDDGVDLEVATYTIVVYVHNVSSVGVRWAMMISLSNSSLYVPFAFNNNTGQSSIETTIDVGFDYYLFYVDDANEHVTLDYVIFTQNPQIDVPDSSHYLEDFADVSDWAVVTGNAPTTDGDVLSWEHPGDSAWDTIECDVPSISGTNTYLEVVMKWNTSAGSRGIYITVDEQDDWSGATQGPLGYQWSVSTSYLTKKGIVTQAVESVRIGMYSTVPAIFYIDLMRIGDETEMGWQHDCSTTEGLADDGDGNIIYTESSDGDILTINGTNDVTSGNIIQFRFLYDTTTTSIDIERDYYPFVSFRYRVTWNTLVDASGVPYLAIRLDGKRAGGGVTPTFPLDDDGDWHTLRGNLQALPYSSTDKYFGIWGDTSAQGEGFEVEIDWAKYYSIANFTLSQESGTTTSDIVYVDSGELVVDKSTSKWIKFEHDPALSAAVATYPVWNCTLSAPNGADYIYYYVGGSWEQYYWSNTRGGFTGTGTLTDLQFVIRHDETLSAIKFIEDSTAPSVLRISATPPEPDDTESVTLSALATDTVEVYKVWFRPITGPTGYSQTDYEATEQADNLWTYEFSSLDEGYWAFKAIAFDGANNSTLDADSVTDFWVREKELIISNTLYTETSTQCSFAGQTNVACDYLIYDDDVEQESGNKAAGSFFLDWTKQTSVGTHDWGIKFYTASSTDWHNGSYEVLTTTLLVTEYGIRTTTNYAYLHGYVNLGSNYTVYEETVQVGTGSVTAGSFEIRWTKASSSVENVTVLFESGSQSYPVYSGYDVAAQVTFVVESWWMDLNLGVESYVEFYVLSSFENATVYVYDNDTLMTTVTESEGGAYSYFWMAESQGLHIITLNITHGGTTHTRTRTYYIPDWAVTGLVLRWDLWTFQDNYTMLSLESNWRNCSYSVYLNGSLVATSANDPVTLNFTRSINVGEYNLTIFADGDTQTYSIKNIRYVITEEGVSYDYSSVTGGRSVAYGDNYYDYYTITGEPTPGILIDQGTATIVSVGGFLIIFTAYLFAREAKKGEILKTERVFNR